MIRVAATVLALCAFIIFVYWAGGRENRATDQLNDKKGAENVRTTTQDAIDGIGPDDDADSVLRRTDGLRDD